MAAALVDLPDKETAPAGGKAEAVLTVGNGAFQAGQQELLLSK
jgi:hypothetical protein